MNLEELQERLGDTGITEEQLAAVTPAYLLLDFGKDDFCQLLKITGIEKWTAKAGRWKRLEQAEYELDCKEQYYESVRRLAELKQEEKELKNYMDKYLSGKYGGINMQEAWKRKDY